MSKHDAAPTHGYVISSHVNKFVVRVCLLLFVSLALVIATLVMKVNSGCDQHADYDWKLFGYELRVGFNQDATTCTDSRIYKR